MSVNDILRSFSQGLLVPAMVLLIIVLVLMAICLGSLLVECFAERRRFKVNPAQVVNRINEARYDEVADIVSGLQMLRVQRDALEVVARNMGLPDEDLYSLAKVEMRHAEEKHSASVKRTDLVTKIAPMVGLMCTLIPLGPGIVAMGNGDVSTLSNSMLTAFDGTVAGLVAAIVANTVSTIRKHWYKNYSVVLEAIMHAILQKAADARAAGVELPCGYVGKDSTGNPVFSETKSVSASVPAREGACA